MSRLIEKLQKPTLLLDRDKALLNLERMISKAERDGIRFRPHFKTHQSAAIGDWFRQRGIDAITCSSLDMALCFAEAGWQDITVAFPVNLRRIDLINQLAERIALNLLVESSPTVHRLEQGLETEVNVWIKIDAGYHRTGISWDDKTSLVEVAQAVDLASHLSLAGLLTHAGHTYQARGTGQVEAIYHQVLSRMKHAQDTLGDMGTDAAISVGDTPGCSLVDALGDVDEIRPGNFIFYDLTQLEIGSCAVRDIAAAVACPVVAMHESRQQILLHGGAVHFSKESLELADGRSVFGAIVSQTDTGWGESLEGSYLVSLSQEHGTVQATAELFAQTQVGDLLTVLPVHSCLTANLFRKYQLLDGTLIDMIPTL